MLWSPSYAAWRRGTPDSEPAWLHNRGVQTGLLSLEAGDVVRLKQGGPAMIVRAVSGDSAYCQWYAGVNLHQGTFLFSSLEDISRQPRPAACAPHHADTPARTDLQI